MGEVAILMKCNSMQLDQDPVLYARSMAKMDHFKWPNFRFDPSLKIVRYMSRIPKKEKLIISRHAGVIGINNAHSFINNTSNLCLAMSNDLQAYADTLEEKYLYTQEGDEGKKIELKPPLGTGLQGYTVQFKTTNYQNVVNKLLKLALDYKTIANQIPQIYQLFSKWGAAHLFIPTWNYISSGAFEDSIKINAIGGLKPAESRITLESLMNRGFDELMARAKDQLCKRFAAKAATRKQGAPCKSKVFECERFRVTSLGFFS